jgi:DNA-binding transcriptional ArsR family regulator
VENNRKSFILFHVLQKNLRANMNLDRSFAALADPTRRAILARLAEGEATVQVLARPFSIRQPAISHHLKVLEDAGLIETRIHGNARPRRLKPDAVETLWLWLGQYRRSGTSNPEA